jgi:hypothetical protein
MSSPLVSDWSDWSGPTCCQKNAYFLKSSGDELAAVKPKEGWGADKLSSLATNFGLYGVYNLEITVFAIQKQLQPVNELKTVPLT